MGAQKGYVMASADTEYCTRCGNVLRRKVVRLELNWKTLEWTTEDKPWPEAESQGCFPFGPDCVQPALDGLPQTPQQKAKTRARGI